MWASKRNERKSMREEEQEKGRVEVQSSINKSLKRENGVG